MVVSVVVMSIIYMVEFGKFCKIVGSVFEWVRVSVVFLLRVIKYVLVRFICRGFRFFL